MTRLAGAAQNTKESMKVDEATRKMLNQPLDESNVGTPLREFVGTFDSYYTTQNKFDKTTVNILFRDIDVVETESPPYTDDTFTMMLGLAKKAKSKWGYFFNSLKAVVVDDEPLEAAVGKRFRVKVTSGHPIWDKESNKEIMHSVWEVIGIESAPASTGADPGMVAMDLINGKTDAEFISAAAANPVIATDAQFRASIINKSWQKMMVESGSIVQVDGRYQLA